MILQPPPAQTMVQALELLYALGGKNQSFQDDIKENQPFAKISMQTWSGIFKDHCSAGRFGQLWPFDWSHGPADGRVSSQPHVCQDASRVWQFRLLQRDRYHRSNDADPEHICRAAQSEESSCECQHILQRITSHAVRKIILLNDLSLVQAKEHRKFAVAEGDHLTMLNVYEAFIKVYSRGTSTAWKCTVHTIQHDLYELVC